MFRISVANATILSGLYLGVGAVAELVRRASGAPWAERLAFGLEAVPAQLLQRLGLLDGIRRAYVEGRLSEAGVRGLYGLTAVALVFSLGLVVGLLMTALVASLQRPPRA